MSSTIHPGGFAVGHSNLGLAVCIEALHEESEGNWLGIGQFGIFKGRDVICNDAQPFTESDVLTFDDEPREAGTKVGYLDGGAFKIADGAEADRIYAERSGDPEPQLCAWCGEALLDDGRGTSTLYYQVHSLTVGWHLDGCSVADELYVGGGLQTPVRDSAALVEQRGAGRVLSGRPAGWAER